MAESSSTTVAKTHNFLVDCGISSSFESDYKDSYADLFRDLLKTQQLQRGSISCVFSVHPAVTNMYNGLFGGAIGAISERIAIACGRTVVGEDKELFVGELSMSYLYAALQNEVVVADARVVRTGRSITVVGIQFRIQNTCKLVYTARATLYHFPVSKL